MMGASVSGVFLWILGILDLIVLIGIIKVFAKIRHGSYNEQELRRPAQRAQLHRPPTYTA